MNEDLYYKIDADEELTDAEKRELYNSEMEAEQDEEDYQEDQC